VEQVRLRDYDRDQPDVDAAAQTALRIAVEWAKAHFACCRVPTDKRSRRDRALAAVEYVKTSDCGKRSPGYPFNQQYKTKALALEDPRVVEGFLIWVEKLGTDLVEVAIFALNLKDEILKSLKVFEKRTRLFMAAPLYHHLAMVMICQLMHDQLMANRGTWCSAGRDFHYGGWNEMVHTLLWDWVFGTDGEMYDMTIHQLLFAAFFEVVKDFIPKEDHRMLEDLFAMALYALLVDSRGHVYMKYTGNPSGWLLTLFLNTIVGYFLLAITWILRFPGSSRSDFETFIRAWLCGDDSAVCVHPSVRSVYTGEAVAETWQRFGMRVKKIEQAHSMEQVEYCGAYTLKMEGVWVRKPRVQKFLDSLCFTKTGDPLMKLQRAYSIYMEMYPVEEREIVLGYVRMLCEKYPACATFYRMVAKPGSELLTLHTGLELQAALGGCVSMGRPKSCVQKSNWILFAHQSVGFADYKLISLMTKTKEQKAAKKAKKKAAQAAFAKAYPKTGMAASIAESVSKVAGKQKKKGGGSFWSILGGAAKMVGELAPIVAPLLLAKHGPTMSRAAMVSGTSTGASAAMAAPLAQSASCAACLGYYGMKAIFGKDGRVIGMRMRGMDYLGGLTVQSMTMGQKLSEIDLNPNSDAWAGTSLQRFATLFERFRPHRVACLVEPACAATTDGQIISYVDTDPDDKLDETGRAAVQIASSHEGADVSQVWGMNVATYAFDEQTQDFYSDANGSDERLISPGTWRILANTTVTLSDPVAIGSKYVIWDYTFRIPQNEAIPAGGAWALLSADGVSGTDPLGPGPWDTQLAGGNLHGNLSIAATGDQNLVNNLPPGYYLALYHGNGTAAYTSGSSPMTVTAAGAYTNAAGSEGPITPEFAINQSTTDFVEVFLFRVATQTDDPSQGLFILQSGVAADTPDIDVWFLRLWDPSGAMARKSLKDFEKDVEAMKKQIAALFSALSVQPKLSTEQLAQAAASHLGAALALSGSAKAKAGAKPLLLQPSK
jgi:hypothetical protein